MSNVRVRVRVVLFAVRFFRPQFNRVRRMHSCKCSPRFTIATLLQMEPITLPLSETLRGRIGRVIVYGDAARAKTHTNARWTRHVIAKALKQMKKWSHRRPLTMCVSVTRCVVTGGRFLCMSVSVCNGNEWSNIVAAGHSVQANEWNYTDYRRPT